MVQALESELMAFMVMVVRIEGLFGVVCTTLNSVIGHMTTSFDFRQIAWLVVEWQTRLCQGIGQQQNQSHAITSKNPQCTGATTSAEVSFQRGDAHLQSAP